MSDAETKRRLTDWFNQWRLPLRKFLSRKARIPKADLEDVSQEVFLRLLRYDSVELVQNPQAYLFKMASNVAAEWSIRAYHQKPHESKWLEGLVDEGLAEDEAARETVQREIERAVNTLSPRLREVLKLQFVEGLGYEDIAARTGMTPRMVKRCMMKSYQKLRNELKSALMGEDRHGPD